MKDKKIKYKKIKFKKIKDKRVKVKEIKNCYFVYLKKFVIILYFFIILLLISQNKLLLSLRNTNNIISYVKSIDEEIQNIKNFININLNNKSFNNLFLYYFLIKLLRIKISIKIIFLNIK